MYNRIERLLFSRGVRAVIAVAVMVVGVGIFSSVSADDSSELGGPDVTIEAESKLSPQEQLSWIKEQTASAQSILHHIKEKLEKARKDKDTLKLTCLDDKLTQLNVTLRGVEERTKSLEVSIQTGNTTAADQNFAILKIYIDRIYKLNAEGENCLGESDVVLGKTSTTTEVDANISIYDPDDPSEDIPVDVGTSPPSELSGHM